MMTHEPTVLVLGGTATNIYLLEYGFTQCRWNAVQLISCLIFGNEAAAASLRMLYVFAANHLRTQTLARAFWQYKRKIRSKTRMFSISVSEAAIARDDAVLKQSCCYLSFPDVAKCRVFDAPWIPRLRRLQKYHRRRS